MKGKDNSRSRQQIQDERTFFSWVEKSLEQKGFQVIETLPRRIYSRKGEAGFKNF
jgi:hypothetical protein